MLNVFFNEDVLKAESEIISSLGISGLVLMENAGRGCAKFILREFPGDIAGEILMITGKGNNAGDGFVAARHLLNEGVRVKLLLLYNESELSGDALLNFNILKKSGYKFLRILNCTNSKQLLKNITPENKIIIDAIFGVGFKGTLDFKMKEIFKSVNSLNGKKIVSLDVPSGLKVFSDCDNCIKADITLSMGVKKFSTMFYEGRESSGRIELINIGVSLDEFTKYSRKKIYEIEETDVTKHLPERKINSNKYSNGKVFILSGSLGLTGAAYLCSMAALRTGSGAVITGIPKAVNDIMEIKMTEVMTLPLGADNEVTLSVKSYSEITDKLKWADAVLIGPGISKSEDALNLVRKIVQNNYLNYVIDADAISAFKNNLKLLKGKKIILTPHIGEFANLTGKKPEEIKKNLYEIAKNFAKEHKIILVLKNSPTVITDGECFYINSTGSENLATAGTGDVLSGIIVSLLSQTNNLLNAAISGVFIHGMCGDNLYSQFGASSLIAGDLINEIPKVKIELSKN